jgi:hypothetical protein
MGLLDDAIREHLELKRKHGANPEDVARQEQEALGPGEQRNEFAQPEPPEEEEPAAVAAEGEPAPPLNEAAPEEAPPPEVAADAAAYEEEPWLDDEPDEVPADEALEQRRESPAAEENPEDVLEETPDFLQETPEHDRLWFEQKPPRDFDWDK